MARGSSVRNVLWSPPDARCALPLATALRARLALALPLALAACGSSAGTTGSTGTDAGGPLSFAPSNLGSFLGTVDLSKLADVDVSGTSNALGVSCNSNPGCVAGTVTQSDGSSAQVYVAKSWKLEPNGLLPATEAMPVIVVGVQTIAILGRLDASGTGQITVAGGHKPANPGPGAGGTGVSGTTTATGTGAGGAGFCGAGGAGGASTASAGKSYGTSTLVPLAGGSAGGSCGLASGAGGGALELVAGVSIDVGAGGAVSVGGGGGDDGDGNYASCAGGSGGALLLEAPTVTVEGTLEANGGAGGGGATGSSTVSDATPNATAAPGGTPGASGAGGNGSAGATTAGAAGGAGDAPGGTNVPGGGGRRRRVDPDQHDLRDRHDLRHRLSRSRLLRDAGDARDTLRPSRSPSRAFSRRGRRSEPGAIRAGRVLPERVPGGRIGARAGAAAHRAELAVAAATVETRVADRAQRRVVPVNVHDVRLAHVAEGEGQEAGGVDRAIVGDEEDPVSVARTCAGRLRLRRRRPEAGAETGREALVKGGAPEARDGIRTWIIETAGDDAAKEGALDGPHDEAVLRRIEEEVRDVLAPLGPQLVDAHPAADVNEEEDLPDVGADLAQERRDLGELLHVAAHHGRVDLDGETVIDERPDRLERLGEVTAHVPDPFVGLRRRAVETDRDCAHAVVAQAIEVASCQGRAHRRGESDPGPRAPRLSEEVEEVGPRQRVSPRHDEDRGRRPEAGDVTEEANPLLRRELAGRRGALRARAAVGARERTGARHLPEEEEWALVVVSGDRMHSRSKCTHGATRQWVAAAMLSTRVSNPARAAWTVAAGPVSLKKYGCSGARTIAPNSAQPGCGLPAAPMPPR